MDTFADMSMEMKIGDNPFEEDRFFGDTAEGTEENALDGFLPVTGPVPDSHGRIRRGRGTGGDGRRKCLP